MAVKLEKYVLGSENAEILVLSNVQVAGNRPEAEYYEEALQELGACTTRVILECQETVGQIERALQIAEREGKRLLVISSFLHYFRVQWLLNHRRHGKNVLVTHLRAWGIPRPRELVSDLILTFVFPVIDRLGKRDAFLAKVEARRLKGKH